MRPRRTTTPQARRFDDRYAAERFIRQQPAPELFEVRQHPVRAKAFAVAQIYWHREGGCIMQGYVAVSPTRNQEELPSSCNLEDLP